MTWKWGFRSVGCFVFGQGMRWNSWWELWCIGGRVGTADLETRAILHTGRMNFDNCRPEVVRLVDALRAQAPQSNHLANQIRYTSIWCLEGVMAGCQSCIWSHQNIRCTCRTCCPWTIFQLYLHTNLVVTGDPWRPHEDLLVSPKVSNLSCNWFLTLDVSPVTLPPLNVTEIDDCLFIQIRTGRMGGASFSGANGGYGSQKLAPNGQPYDIWAQQGFPVQGPNGWTQWVTFMFMLQTWVGPSYIV